jgi:hypothetical protein
VYPRSIPNQARFSTSIVKVLIGQTENEQMFVMHESVLAARSTLFGHALQWRHERAEWERNNQEYYLEEGEQWLRDKEGKERAEELERLPSGKCSGDCEKAQREEYVAQFHEEKESYEHWEGSFSRRAQFVLEQQQNPILWNHERYVWDEDHYDKE